ncbi:MAG: fumarate reductase/succinate dehydrogenase flavoprotein subunit [Bdellovibrionales bacterium]|nr:fumarate reductase/succinate dehydrogenase flavoprotein subunit [Bdellovibrionales bacterium]
MIDIHPLKSSIPEGPLAEKWDNYKFSARLVNPSNRKKFEIIVVGAGLAGASASASLGELGYNVKTFFIHDSPRRAHSIAAQGGINAAKNYANDGDSVYRLFYDTIKGGDFRAREANVYRLAQISNQIIDHCVAQGVPFAREYGGLLANRSFGGAQVSRTFYARGQTGQQLLLGAYGSLMKQVDQGKVTLYPYTEMLDLIVSEGHARGIVARDLVTGEVTIHTAHAVLVASGGYGNVFYLSTNAMNSNVTAAWRCHKRGAYFANPSFVQIHPTCIPQSGEHQSKLTLMSESLRNDGRVWVPLKKEDSRLPQDIPEEERDYYLERIYPAFGNLVPRDVASRQAKFQVDQGRGVGVSGEAVYLDFTQALRNQGIKGIREKYGNLFSMYERITGENPYKTPMRIFPAVHYTMGGLWVDYDLQSTVPGLFVLGEANFSDHGANRLGASALMQGLADGYFIAPATVGNYLAGLKEESLNLEDCERAKRETEDRLTKLLNLKGSQSVDQIHRKLGRILWDFSGMIRSENSLKKALEQVRSLRQEFWNEAVVPGQNDYKNQELEKAGRVADFLELGEILIRDALIREESCGCHFREEYQTQDNEALRNDENFSHVTAWEWSEENKWREWREPLSFLKVKPSQRSYK